MGTYTKIEAIKKMLKHNEHLSISELHKRTGLSRTVFYAWRSGRFENIHERSVRLIAKATNTNVSIDGDRVHIVNTDIDVKGIKSMEAQSIIENQEALISYQKKEIISLKNVIKEKQVESNHWETLEYDYTAKVSLHRTGFKLGRTMDEVTHVKKQSEVLGIGNKYIGMSGHSIEKIINKETLKEIKKQSLTLPIMFDALKASVGDHYIPQPLIFIHKQGHNVGAISYNKVEWKKMIVHSKVKFLLN